MLSKTFMFWVTVGYSQKNDLLTFQISYSECDMFHENNSSLIIVMSYSMKYPSKWPQDIGLQLNIFCLGPMFTD